MDGLCDRSVGDERSLHPQIFIEAGKLDHHSSLHRESDARVDRHIASDHIGAVGQAPGSVGSNDAADIGGGCARLRVVGLQAGSIRLACRWLKRRSLWGGVDFFCLRRCACEILLIGRRRNCRRRARRNLLIGRRRSALIGSRNGRRSNAACLHIVIVDRRANRRCADNQHLHHIWAGGNVALIAVGHGRGRADDASQVVDRVVIVVRCAYAGRLFLDQAVGRVIGVLTERPSSVSNAGQVAHTIEGIVCLAAKGIRLTRDPIQHIVGVDSGVAASVGDLGQVIVGVIDILPGLPQGVCGHGQPRAAIIGKLGDATFSVGNFGQITRRVIEHICLESQGVGQPGHVAKAIVGQSDGLVEGVGHGERLTKAVVGKPVILPQRVCDLCEVALAVIPIGDDAANRIGHAGGQIEHRLIGRAGAGEGAVTRHIAACVIAKALGRLVNVDEAAAVVVGVVEGLHGVAHLGHQTLGIGDVSRCDAPFVGRAGLIVPIGQAALLIERILVRCHTAFTVIA